MNKTVIITPAFNKFEMATKPFLQSLYQYTDENSFDLIIIDNGSTDGTVEYLENYVISYMFQLGIDKLTDIEKYLAFSTDAVDMLPDNVYVYDLYYLAFKRWFTNSFTKYWIAQSVSIDENNAKHDFTQFDTNITFVDTKYSGLVTIHLTLR